MTTTAPHSAHHTTPERILFVAFALREKTWKLGCTTGPGPKPRERRIAARHQPRVLQESAQAQRRFGLPETAPVVSCYAAGREGFWGHRFLQAHGLTTHVVASSSIAVHRRQRRAQSEGLDGRKLLRRLRRYESGAREVWRVVHVPSVEAEDHRHRHRDLETRKQERASTTTRLKGVLSSQGVRVTSLSQWPAQLAARRLGEGSPLPSGLRRRVLRVWAHHEFLSQQMAAWEAERRALLDSVQAASSEKVRQLLPLQGIGLNGAWVLVRELFAWREVKKRRAVGGVAGFTPTPYQSGASARDQGITTAGQRHVRWMPTAWAWHGLRYQPESALRCWFRERCGGGGTRLRRLGLVAVARKLLIALWRFLETGGLPEGAALKAV